MEIWENEAIIMALLVLNTPEKIYAAFRNKFQGRERETKEAFGFKTGNRLSGFNFRFEFLLFLRNNHFRKGKKRLGT